MVVGVAVMLPINILVVDDHPGYREAFCNMLHLCFDQIQVVPVDDGSRALSVTQQLPFDLIVLDYHLKSISGGDVIRHLRARARATGQQLPPIILMSSHPDIAVFARSLGALAFLAKPVDIADVERVIGPVLDNARPHRAVAACPASP
jgi:CheY-like chemotaxis protein